jgi:hypothetical protein
MMETQDYFKKKKKFQCLIYHAGDIHSCILSRALGNAKKTTYLLLVIIQ